MSPVFPLSRSLVLSLFQQSVVLRDALSSELFQDVVEVSGIGEAVARQVGTKLSLMVDLEGEAKDFVICFCDNKPDIYVGLSIGTQYL